MLLHIKEAIKSKNDFYLIGILDDIKMRGAQQSDLNIIREIVIYLVWSSHVHEDIRRQYYLEFMMIYMELSRSLNIIDWRYSDIFTTYFDRINNSKNLNNLDPLNYCDERDHTKYHYFLYKALQYYLNDNEYVSREYFSIAGKIYRDLAKHKRYSNHNIRGLQYIFSNQDIENYLEYKKIIKKNIEFSLFNIEMKEESLVYLISLDTKYFDRFYDYVITKSDAFIKHIHIINPNKEQMDKLKYLKINHSHEYEDFIDKKPYFISNRFLIANQILEIYKCHNLIITDADSILYEDELLKVIKEFNKSNKDLGIICSDSYYPWSKYAAGIVITNNTEQTKDFFNIFNRLFFQVFDRDRNSIMNTQWWIDQGIIYSLVGYLGLKVFNLLRFSKRLIYFPSGDKERDLANKKVKI